MSARISTGVDTAFVSLLFITMIPIDRKITFFSLYLRQITQYALIFIAQLLHKF